MLSFPFVFLCFCGFGSRFALLLHLAANQGRLGAVIPADAYDKFFSRGQVGWSSSCHDSGFVLQADSTQRSTWSALKQNTRVRSYMHACVCVSLSLDLCTSGEPVVCVSAASKRRIRLLPRPVCRSHCGLHQPTRVPGSSSPCVCVCVCACVCVHVPVCLSGWLAGWLAGSCQCVLLWVPVSFPCCLLLCSFSSHTHTHTRTLTHSLPCVQSLRPATLCGRRCKKTPGPSSPSITTRS